MYIAVRTKMRKLADPETYFIYLLFHFFTFLMFRQLLKQPPTKR